MLIILIVVVISCNIVVIDIVTVVCANVQRIEIPDDWPALKSLQIIGNISFRFVRKVDIKIRCVDCI